MVYYSPAQKRAYARKMQAMRNNQIAPAVYGQGAYYQRAYPNVYRPVVARGQGAYNLGRVMRKGAKRIVKTKGFSRAVGSAIGGAFGNPAIGATVGATIGKAFGMGDYTVKENSLLAGGIPQVISSSDRSFVVRHREYLQNISTAADASFNLLTFPIQPGLSSVFPWLSQLAVGFQQYKIKGMIWEYKGTSSDSLSSTTTALGTVIMATEYDSSSEPFLNQQQMANHEFANSCKPSSNMLHAIECKKSLSTLSELYVRSGAVPQGDDERFFDFGLFQIATVGGPAVANDIGELWVSYEVEFLKPQLITGLGLQLKSDHWTSSTSVTTSNYFGTDYASAMNAGSNLGCTLTNNDIVFPPSLSEGKYKVDIIWTGDGVSPGAQAAPTVTANASCSLSGTVAVPPSAEAATSNATLLSFYVTIAAQNASVAFSGGTLPTGANSVDLVINQYNSGTQ